MKTLAILAATAALLLPGLAQDFGNWTFYQFPTNGATCLDYNQKPVNFTTEFLEQAAFQWKDGPVSDPDSADAAPSTCAWLHGVPQYWVRLLGVPPRPLPHPQS